MPRISLVIPVYNEEKYLGRTLASVLRAIEFYRRERDEDAEVIVVDNDSTDKTAEVAGRFGVRITPFKAKNQMAAARNAGAKLARGDILTFLDAGSLVSKNVFVCVDEVLGSGEIIGGGVDIRPDSSRLDFKLTFGLLRFLCRRLKVGGGLFYLHRKTFEALGGFDETLWALEDLEFAKRLRDEGKKHGKKFRLLKDAYILTSTRKWDKINVSNAYFAIFKFIIPMIRMALFGPSERFLKRLRDRDYWFRYYYDADGLR